MKVKSIHVDQNVNFLKNLAKIKIALMFTKHHLLHKQRLFFKTLLFVCVVGVLVCVVVVVVVAVVVVVVVVGVVVVVVVVIVVFVVVFIVDVENDDDE